MNEAEFRAMLHSDMKLWDYAEDTEVTATSVTKVLELPWGIGRTEVKLEGLVDGAARRGALAGFADYIRGLVNDKIGDDSVTARAKQSAAKTSEVYGGEPAREMVSEGAPVSNPEAVAAPDATSFNPTVMANRAEYLRDTIARREEDIDALRKELKGIEAFLEVTNASADTKTPDKNPA